MSSGGPVIEPRRRSPTRVGRRTHIHREAGAWSVHVMRGRRTYSDYIPDAVWGGRKQSLLAAQRFRDGLLQRIEPDTRVRSRVPKGTRSDTEVVGVILEEYVVDDRVYERIIANWVDAEGRYRRRRFSVGRYGRRKAFTLAVEVREQGVEHARAALLARQREEAALRLSAAPPMPRKVKDPRSRKGINMGRRRPRRSDPR